MDVLASTPGTLQAVNNLIYEAMDRPVSASVQESSQRPRYVTKRDGPLAVESAKKVGKPPRYVV